LERRIIRILIRGLQNIGQEYCRILEWRTAEYLTGGLQNILQEDGRMLDRKTVEFYQEEWKNIKHEYCRIWTRAAVAKTAACSEITLIGESRFHISTPLGIEPGSLMTGSKRVNHLTSGTVYECSEIAGSPQGSPPAVDYVGCEAGRRACSKRETMTEELCEIKWDYHIVGTMA
jgi:hypothetical protein